MSKVFVPSECKITVKHKRMLRRKWNVMPDDKKHRPLSPEHAQWLKVRARRLEHQYHANVREWWPDVEFILDPGGWSCWWRLWYRSPQGNKFFVLRRLESGGWSLNNTSKLVVWATVDECMAAFVAWRLEHGA